jgi:Tfp pilus assembly protein PilF
MSPDEALGLAMRYHAAGLIDQAESVYRQLLAQFPNHPQILTQFCRLLLDQGKIDEAIAAQQKALALHPGDAATLNNLGRSLALRGDPTAATQCFRQAIALHPQDAQAYHNLAMLLFWRDQFDESIQMFQRGLAIQPEDAIGHYNLGTVLMEQNRLDDAIAEFERSAAIDPKFANSTWNLSWALLKQGRLLEGWRAYEVRWHMKQWQALRRFPRPLWDGGDLAGKRILLHTEQGFGDAIQMARFVPMVAARGGTVYLDCQPPLQPLFAGMRGVERVIASGERLPPYDVQCPLMSLPGRLGITLQTILREVPYLAADPAKVERWRQRVANGSRDLKVGVAWSGRAYPAGRSIEPEMLAPLLGIKDVKFYGLNAPTEDPAIQTSLQSPNLIELGLELTDFAETAALLMNLDLVITIDTAVAHLAGALGRPTWLLLRFAPDWRWMLERTDSGWYPTMKLFRQHVRNDWSVPINEAAAALRELTAAIARTGTKL